MDYAPHIRLFLVGGPSATMEVDDTPLLRLAGEEWRVIHTGPNTTRATGRRWLEGEHLLESAALLRAHALWSGRAPAWRRRG